MTVIYRKQTEGLGVAQVIYMGNDATRRQVMIYTRYARASLDKQSSVVTPTFVYHD